MRSRRGGGGRGQGNEGTDRKRGNGRKELKRAMVIGVRGVRVVCVASERSERGGHLLQRAWWPQCAWYACPGRMMCLACTWRHPPHEAREQSRKRPSYSQ